MKIGIIGSGDVGRALGNGFVQTGHEVKLGSREPEQDRLRSWEAQMGPKATLGTFAEAARFGDLVILATSWSGAENALRLAGQENLSGKVVIDATNALDFSKGGQPALAVGHIDSAGERVQRWAPGARVVKAFNMVGNAHMFRPDFPGGPPDMFICGNDAAAKETVTGILKSFGWSTVDLGPIEASRLIEPLAMVWITYAFGTNTWNHAFKLLRK
jgi:8-hydroxy-5-deazaflavin:NADPH oxidoreductase